MDNIIESIELKVKGEVCKVTIGDTYNNYTIVKIYRGDYSKNKNSVLADCLCSCGNSKTVLLYSVVSGISKSCGCLLKKVNQSRKLYRSNSEKRLHNIWCGMKSRCYTVTNISYKNYGGVVG